MKKIIFSILTAGLFFLTSCEKFLEEKPKSQFSMNTFFSSPADGEAAVNALYRIGFPVYYDAGSAYRAPRVTYGNFMAGLFDNEFKGQEPFISDCQTMSIDNDVRNSDLQDIWQPSYEAITRRCNYAIKYLPECEGLGDVQRAQLIAESRFFRALNYFWLVKMFGAVPLITEPYESMENLFIPRSTEANVYALIVSDLEDALKNGQLPDRPMPENNFRVSKGSVTALLADVYLNMAGYPLNDNSKYARAAELAQSLINNANYALIENVDMAENSAYNILRTSDNQKEYLYVIEYDESIARGGWRPTYCFSGQAASWQEFTWSIYCLVDNPVPKLLDIYDQTNDLRYQDGQYFHSSYTQTKAPNAGTVHEFGAKYPYFWFEANALLNTNHSEKDQAHYRLTEMYLIAAEALVATGTSVTDEAADYLATIKARASLNKTKAEIKANLLTLSKENFIAEVWREKIREFFFENKMWNDITRTRKYPTNFANGQCDFVDLIGATNPWGKTFAEANLYLPICSQEMQRNPALADAPQ